MGEKVGRDQANQFVGRLEKAGLTKNLAQVVVKSKGNVAGQEVVNFIRSLSEEESHQPVAESEEELQRKEAERLANWVRSIEEEIGIKIRSVPDLEVKKLWGDKTQPDFSSCVTELVREGIRNSIGKRGEYNYVMKLVAAFHFGYDGKFSNVLPCFYIYKDCVKNKRRFNLGMPEPSRPVFRLFQQAPDHWKELRDWIEDGVEDLKFRFYEQRNKMVPSEQLDRETEQWMQSVEREEEIEKAAEELYEQIESVRELIQLHFDCLPANICKDSCLFSVETNSLSGRYFGWKMTLGFAQNKSAELRVYKQMAPSARGLLTTKENLVEILHTKEEPNWKILVEIIEELLPQLRNRFDLKLRECVYKLPRETQNLYWALVAEKDSHKD